MWQLVEVDYAALEKQIDEEEKQYQAYAATGSPANASLVAHSSSNMQQPAFQKRFAIGKWSCFPMSRMGWLIGFVSETTNWLLYIIASRCCYAHTNHDITITSTLT